MSARSCSVLPAAAAAHLPRVHAAARRILGCDHLAADAVQETLLALWQQPQSPPDLRGWLVRTAVHRSLHLRRTLLRRRRRERAPADETAARSPALRVACGNPLHQAWACELGERIERALASLPADQRAAFELFESSGLDYVAVAARLRAPIGTVRSRLHRARAALQRALMPLAAE